jgi:hypothetical protein
LPLFQTTALSKADREARGAPKGVQLAPPVTLRDGQFVRDEGDGATPKTETPAQLPVLPTPSAADLSVMSNQGLAAIVTDMQAHPQRYSPEYRSAIGREMSKPSRQASGASGG